MKPRLLIGNFDFEHRLAELAWEAPARLKRLNAELAPTWLSIADDGDRIWTPWPIDEVFFQNAERAGLPRVVPVTSWQDVPRHAECVPWGWSADVPHLVERYGWSANIPSDEAVRAANSRTTSDELERRWNVGLPEAHRIETLADFKNAIHSLRRSDGRWVVKAEFGMSARERILGRGSARLADENWVRRRLASSGVVFFEPWVDRIDEIGIQIEIPREGQPQLIGLTPMIVDERGQYAGSWFAYDDSRFQADRMLWSEGINTALRAATHVQMLGYFGPLGIDAMVYLDVDGSRRIRPLQDINARWTMGRLSLGWRRLLEPGELGFWQLGSADSLPVQADLNVTRIVETSPESIRESCCEHRSRVLIQSLADKRGLTP